MRSIRYLFILALLGVVVYVGATVPIGGKTVLSRILAQFSQSGQNQIQNEDDPANLDHHTEEERKNLSNLIESKLAKDGP